MKGQAARKRRATEARTHKRTARTQQRQKAARRVDMIVNRAQARTNAQRKTFALPVAVPKPVTRQLDIARWLEKRRAA